MKQLIKIDIDKLVTENNNYTSGAFKRDKTDLSFLSRQDLCRHAFEELFTSEEQEDKIPAFDDLSYGQQTREINKLFRNKTMTELQAIYLLGAEKTILIGVEEVSVELFNELKNVPDAEIHIIESNEDKLLANNDILFVYNLINNNINYELC